MIWESPANHIQQDTPQSVGQGGAKVEAHVDGSRLRVGKTVQLQPHGEIAEGEPRGSAKNALADDDQKSGQTKDLPQPWCFIPQNVQHLPLFHLG